MKRAILITFFSLFFTLGLIGCASKESGPGDGKPKTDAAGNSTAAKGSPSDVTKNFLEAERGRGRSPLRPILHSLVYLLLAMFLSCSRYMFGSSPVQRLCTC